MTNLPRYVQMFISDDENKLVLNKSMQVSFRLATDERTAYIDVPPTKKVDHSQNTILHLCKQSGLTFRVIKSGKINASGHLTREKIRKIGYDVLRQEFLEAVDKIWEHATA